MNRKNLRERAGCKNRLPVVLRAGALGVGLTAVLLAGCARPSISEGRALYQANGCASCHGPEARGDGPMAANLPVRPIDLHDISQLKRGASEDAIAQTLEEGVSTVHSVPALQETHHVLVMPKFDHLTETERRSIALYLISLR